MLILLSPTKTFLTYNKETLDTQSLLFKSQTLELCNHLKGLDQKTLSKLLKTSDQLTKVNYERYQDFPFAKEGVSAAIYSFIGEVFKSLDSQSLAEPEIDYLQQHLVILSGLYGAIRPLQPIVPYRLEMGSSLKFGSYKNLYEYWRAPLTTYILRLLDQSPNNKVLINLASGEYSKALDLNAIQKQYPVITPVFKSKTEKGYKVIGIYAKRARGLMVRELATKQIQNVEDLKQFNRDGYCYNQELSRQYEWVFTK